jgi:thiamine-phosphate pyrophosphorylase
MSLRERLRLMVITSPDPRAGDLDRVVGECIEAGATAIQLRDKRASSRELFETAARLAGVVRTGGALFIVNDRFDVARAANADGVHLGPDDVPPAAVRAAVPSDFVLGYSTDDPATAARVESEGVDYLGVGALFGTSSKAGLGDEAIGTAGLRRVIEAVEIPCVGIGGVTARNAGSVVAVGAGLAVLSWVMDAVAPGDAVRSLLAAMDAQRG